MSRRLAMICVREDGGFNWAASSIGEKASDLDIL